ncbi:rhodanese-like domain-containing protein [Streptomyces boninensis]|uniref:rhodanese-like domain-containing protein n=1 Tax=Streptomyces boninensis TaxID=2039455 RepID=UPI003B22296A
MTATATTLTPAQLHALDADTHTVIDVRAPGEHASGHIPDAVNVPLDQFATLIPELRAAAERRELVLVCAAGLRSENARTQLAEAGVSARSLTGGTDGWRAAGLPVHTAKTEGRTPWAMDRQVRFTAGLLVLIGIAIGLITPYGLILSAGIAAGLVYSGISNTCGMAALLGKLPFNRPRPEALDTARKELAK